MCNNESMKERNEDLSTSNKCERKNECSIKIRIIITALLAICGIAIGVCGLVENQRRIDEIGELNKKIVRLNEQINELKAVTRKITTIKIVRNTWSSWVESSEKVNGKPKNNEVFCKIKLNAECNGGGSIGGGLVFKITEVSEDSVKIHTTKSYSDKDGGIDLFTDKKDFVINATEPLELTTPTMDAGEIFTLTLE